MNDYTFHECDLASIWLPNSCKIGQPLPRLAAEVEKGMITVDLLVDDYLWNVSKKSMNETLPNNPQNELSIVRLGAANVGYIGLERVTQTRVLATNYLLCNWEILLEDSDRRVEISFFGPGQFADHEEGWTRVLKSFRFK